VLVVTGNAFKNVSVITVWDAVMIVSLRNALVATINPLLVEND